MKIKANRERCEGHGFCEELAPRLLKVDEDGVVQVVRSEVSEDDLPDAEAAVATCPVSALRLE